MPVCTLLTDFGAADYYVAAVKGVLSSRAPGAALLDLGHEVAPGDWLESLIDPAVRALSEELDNLSFVRSLREVEPRAPWSRCRASRPRPSTW